MGKNGNRDSVKRVFQDIKTANYQAFELFQQRRSRYRRQLASNLHLRIESVYLNTIDWSGRMYMWLGKEFGTSEDRALRIPTIIPAL